MAHVRLSSQSLVLVQVEVEGSSGIQKCALTPCGPSSSHPTPAGRDSGGPANQAGEASIAASLDRMQSYPHEQAGSASGAKTVWPVKLLVIPENVACF